MIKSKKLHSTCLKYDILKSVVLVIFRNFAHSMGRSVRMCVIPDRFPRLPDRPHVGM